MRAFLTYLVLAGLQTTWVYLEEPSIARAMTALTVGHLVMAGLFPKLVRLTASLYLDFGAGLLFAAAFPSGLGLALVITGTAVGAVTSLLTFAPYELAPRHGEQLVLRERRRPMMDQW